MRRFDHQSQGTRPEFVSEFQERIRNVAGQLDGLFDRADEDRQGPRFRAAFDLENLLDRGQIEGVGRKAIDGIRRNADHLATLDELGGVVDDVALGRRG